MGTLLGADAVMLAFVEAGAIQPVQQRVEQGRRDQTGELHEGMPAEVIGRRGNRGV